MVPEIVRKEATQSHIYTFSGQAVESIIGCKIYLVQRRMNEQYLEEDILLCLFLCLSYSFLFPFEFVFLVFFF